MCCDIYNNDNHVVDTGLCRDVNVTCANKVFVTLLNTCQMDAYIDDQWERFDITKYMR